MARENVFTISESIRWFLSNINQIDQNLETSLPKVSMSLDLHTFKIYLLLRGI